MNRVMFYRQTMKRKDGNSKKKNQEEMWRIKNTETETEEFLWWAC